MKPLHKKTKRGFTPAEDDILRACWKAEASSADIRAAIPGRMFSTLIGRASVLGLPKRNFRLKHRSCGAPERHPAISDARGQIELGDEDQRYVDRCRAAGGFPALMLIAGRSVMVWPFERAA